MISSKFLYDDGEGDEVFMDEWATSGGVTIKEMLVLERDFLTAIVSLTLVFKISTNDVFNRIGKYSLTKKHFGIG